MLRIYLHRTHPSIASESLIIRILISIFGGDIVNDIESASLVICGAPGFYRKSSALNLHKIPKIRNHILIKDKPLAAKKDQVTLYVSSEPPPQGYWSKSNCEFAITSELPSSSSVHFRLPYWMEHIDWQDFGVPPASLNRAGVLPKPNELLKSRQPDQILGKQWKFPIFASHLDNFRAYIVEQVSSAAEVVGYGPYYDPIVAHHSSSPYTKASILSDYAFNLCPENSIYPGYCTEKILEAWSCNTIPFTFVDPISAKHDFNDRAFVNLYSHAFSISELIEKILCNRSFLYDVASQPLFLHPPTLENLIKFLEQIIDRSI